MTWARVLEARPESQHPVWPGLLVSEPASLVLLGIGLLGVLGYTRHAGSLN